MTPSGAAKLLAAVCWTWSKEEVHDGEKIWRDIRRRALQTEHLPFDLWTKRLARKFQESGPRVIQEPDGTRRWIIEGHAWSGVGWRGVGLGSVNCYTRAELAEEPAPGIFRAANARYRCEDMDRDGVDAELVNGPYEQMSAIKEPGLRVACVRAVNDWAREPPPL
jgi:hypothetical protein